MPSPPPRFRPSLPPSKMRLVSRAKKSFPLSQRHPKKEYIPTHTTPHSALLSLSLLGNPKLEGELGQRQRRRDEWGRTVHSGKAERRGREGRWGGRAGWGRADAAVAGGAAPSASVRTPSSLACAEREMPMGELMTARARCAIEPRLCPRCWHASILAAAAASMYYCAPMRLKKRNSASSPFSRPPP